MVRNWRVDYDKLSQQVDVGTAKKRKCGSGRQPLFSELEGFICEWVAHRRVMALVVSRTDIQAFALANAPQFGIGMTAYLQTIENAINKSFKDPLHMEIDDYIENKMVRNQRGNFVKPGLQEIVTWETNSWNKITDSCVANALRAGYLDKNFPFNETAIARHERLRTNVLQEMESHENFAGILESSDLQHNDIQEDDDMTVFQ
ncbi:Hypothetical predicted protein [Octopus vulgaris]|uniref:Uncharacterized protein n=1 Tax=Octopus vulgaris TaxID=6645 RepID=A0AA36FBM5_OCTVU|nr:Hypothetical predicted protein [Octopus vulgaris]